MIVKQVKYYNEEEQKFLNNPVDITAEELVNGHYFSTFICDEIRINAYPGTTLFINDEEVMIGEAGVYNILYREKVQIISLRVAESSINFIKEHPYAHLIITFIENE